MGKGRKQADHRADLRGKPFIGLPAAVLYSPAYTSLSPPARALLLEILARFNGYNNGEIAISQRELAARLSTSNYRRISQATGELLQHGLIDIAAEAPWKQRHAREYRLTFISTGRAPPYRPATNDYLQIPPVAFSRADTGSAERRRSADTGSAGRPTAADDASAGIRRNPPVGGNPSADTGSTLIVKPYQGPDNLIVFPVASVGCEQCGEAFPPGSRGKPKRFCSEQCRKRAETRRRRERSA